MFKYCFEIPLEPTRYDLLRVQNNNFNKKTNWWYHTYSILQNKITKIKSQNKNTEKLQKKTRNNFYGKKQTET